MSFCSVAPSDKALPGRGKALVCECQHWGELKCGDEWLLLAGRRR
jgi:hypothetical protein